MGRRSSHEDSPHAALSLGPSVARLGVASVGFDLAWARRPGPWCVQDASWFSRLAKVRLRAAVCCGVLGWGHRPLGVAEHRSSVLSTTCVEGELE
eukprot:6379639-Alexandrium_andersonii.AAC.1